MTAAWIVTVFLLGGGSSPDIQSLMLLRPAAVLILFYALATTSAAQARENRTILIFAAAFICLHIIQLMPLPPSIWHAFPGRDLTVEIDRQAGLGQPWRPLTFVPYMTRNSMWALAVPVSVLLLGIQLEPRERTNLLLVIVALGWFSGLLALLQILGDPQGPLYLYRVTNAGTLVGIFANRNHHAFFLATLIPIALAWANSRTVLESRDRRFRRAAAFASVAFFAMLLLVNGSRTGLLVAIVAAIFYGVIVLRLKNPSRERTAKAGQISLRVRALSAGKWIVPVGLAALFGAALLLGRVVAFDRFSQASTIDDMRVRILPTVSAMIKLYWPWGTGFGTFEQVYFVHEPQELLGPSYMNHAHNDWLELVLTAGVPGIILTLLFTGWFVVRVWAVARSNDRTSNMLLPWLGLLTILIFALASVTDYPLRTPSLAALAALAVLWATTTPGLRHSSRSRAENN